MWSKFKCTIRFYPSLQGCLRCDTQQNLFSYHQPFFPPFFHFWHSNTECHSNSDQWHTFLAVVDTLVFGIFLLILTASIALIILIYRKYSLHIKTLYTLKYMTVKVLTLFLISQYMQRLYPALSGQWKFSYCVSVDLNLKNGGKWPSYSFASFINYLSRLTVKFEVTRINLLSENIWILGLTSLSYPLVNFLFS